MKSFVILLFFVFCQCDLTTGDTLDYQCNAITSTIISNTATTYYIIDGQQYAMLCKVKFDSISTTVLSISGPSLDCSICHVSVWDEDDELSKSDGDICSAGYFKNTYQSDSTGDINLHVQGTDCAMADLTIEVHQSCTTLQFQCDNYQCVDSDDRCDNWNDCSDGSDEIGCFWSQTTVHVGVYVGAPIGSLVLVGLATAGLIARRRRLIVSRSTVLVPANQAAVTQSRW